MECLHAPFAHLWLPSAASHSFACTDFGDPGGDAPFNSHSSKAVKLSAPLLVGDPGASSSMLSREMGNSAVRRTSYTGLLAHHMVKLYSRSTVACMPATI